MNKQRRKEIRDIIQKLEQICDKLNTDYVIEDITSRLMEIGDEIGFILFDEECYKENIPENMQGGSKYEAAEEACENLEYAKDSIDDASERMDNKDTLFKCIEHGIDYLYDAI